MELITVITPTWNRSDYLIRVYNSLLSQSYKKFEWLICDDNSTDNTLQVLKRFKSQKKIKIKIYSFPERVGKASMDNYAIKAAKGKFIYVADSDDSFSSNFFLDMISEWKKIPNNLKKKIFAITSPCLIIKKKSIKYNLKKNFISSSELWYKLSKRQESALFLIADVLKKYKFKEIDYYVPEGILWDKIGLKYHLWVVDKCYRNFYSDTPNSITHSKKINYIFGQHYALKESLNLYSKIKYFDLKTFLYCCINLNRYNFHTSQNFFKQLRLLKILSTKILYCSTYLFGYILYIKDKYQKKVIVLKYKKKKFTPAVL
jgi:glycosyltransferase involved in cell wall biosynthesis